MPLEAWLTLAVVVVTVVVLALDVTSPAGVVFGGVVLLLLADVLDPASALSGFGNPAPATVAALYVVAAGLERTGFVHRLVSSVMGGAARDRVVLARLLAPSASASAFVNNTPIVAMAIPAVDRWSERAGRPVGALLMPLSFAAILGGMVTVIGTSTHVVVSGLLEQSGMDPFSFFEVAPAGAPIAVVGLATLIAVSPALLPERRSARRDIDDAREYTVEVRVEPGGPIDGATVGEASLRHLAGVFLVQVERDGNPLGAVGPEFQLSGDDILRFVGNARDATDVHERPGLGPVADPAGVIPTGRMAFFEAVIGVGSALVGRTLRDVGFRERYRAGVLAIHRADQRVTGKLGEAQLRVGDTLLVLAGPAFRTDWAGSSEFLFISRLDAPDPHRTEKVFPAGILALAMVTVAATGILSILEAALVAAFAMVITGVLTPSEARRAVDLNVIVLIAASFGLGAAISGSGLAETLASGLATAVSGSGDAVVVAALAVLTILLTEAVTNNGAAVLIFPIGLALAAETGIDSRTLAVTISIAASASFLTPIGYQTNTMVWGPGGYRFGDYARLGFPLTVLTVAGLAGAVLI